MLDFKLADGVVAMLHKFGDKAQRIRDRINLKMEETSRRGKVLKGRQMVWMVCESFKTFDQTELIYGFDHLSQLKITNHDLHAFVVSWNHVLENMGDNAMSEKMLRDVFYRKINSDKELAYDLNRYERMKEGTGEKTYAFLVDCVESAIKVQGQKKNLLEK